MYLRNWRKYWPEDEEHSQPDTESKESSLYDNNNRDVEGDEEDSQKDTERKESSLYDNNNKDVEGDQRGKKTRIFYKIRDSRMNRKLKKFSRQPDAFGK